MFKCILLTVLIAFVLLGCPSASDLRLAGDDRLVGTWEGNNIVLGYHVYSRSTFDAEGNVVSFFRVQEDNSTSTAGGKWYADPDQGFIDVMREWTLPNVPEAEGTLKGLYEIRSNTCETWNNTVGMARPQNRESAATHSVSSKVTVKGTDIDLETMAMPGIAQQLIDYLY